MSAIGMASATKFSYQRLKNEIGFDDDYEERVRVIGRARNWSKFRKIPSRKRFKLRIPSLRRFFRRKARLLSNVRVSCARVLKRFRENQPYLGDLFAGNYFFLQVSPTPLKCVEKSFKGQDLHGLSSRYSLAKIA